MSVARFVLTACLVVFGACASLAAPVPAENLGLDSAPVAAPQWRAGSTWEYSDGYGLRVASATDSMTVFQRLDAPDQWFSMRGFLRQDAASAKTKRQTIYRTVPPTAGDGLAPGTPLTFQREYLSNNQLIVHASSLTVEGRQRITVPAGTFDCWVIVWRARSLKSNWTGFERWWYSPETQQYVRLEYKYGAGATASRVLMRYHLGESGEMSPAGVAPTAAKSGSSTEHNQDVVPEAPAASAMRLIATRTATAVMPPPAPLTEMAITEAGPENPPVATASTDQPVAIPVPKPKMIASTQTPKAKRRRTNKGR
jgi:hypothetical protein